VPKDGTRSTVSALKIGNPVSVHVLTSGSSSVVERIFAGQLPACGGGGRFGDGDGGPPPDVGSDGTPPAGSIPGGSGTLGGTTGGTGTATT